MDFLTEEMLKFIPAVMCIIVLLIGGGICKEGENLTKPLEEFVKRESYCIDPARSTKLDICKLGNDAGIIGAAFLYTLA